MRIIRHQIEITDYQVIKMPRGERLSVAASRTLPERDIDLWSLDMEDGSSDWSGIYVIGTGNPMPDILRSNQERFNQGDPIVAGDMRWRRFIGTVVTPSGLVWHVFEGTVR